MADMPPRGAAASAFSRLKPEIYKTNDAKVIVEDELLNFLVVKMRTLSHDEIVLLVTSSFTSEWIESAKKALFEVCPDASQCCTTFKGQQKDINNVKLCMKVLNECDVSTLLGRMEQLNSEICCMKRTESNVCESLREVTAAIDGRLTAVEQLLPSVSGPVAAERISDATVQRETTALTPTVAARSSSQTQSPAWTTVVRKAGRSKPAPGNSAVQLRPHLGKTPARSERKKTGIIATGTADDLSRQLNECKTGCIVGDQVVNHLMYADDLVVLCPYTAGLQQLLRICTQYGGKFNINYNAKKSKVIVVRSREDKKSFFPAFYLSDGSLDMLKQLKYLGHVFSDDLMDDSDIRHQCCKIYAQANTLLRKFSLCSADVKCALFRAYVTPLYTAHLWSSYRVKSMQRLRVAYNDAMRLLLHVPRWYSASQLFVSSNVPTCQALLRKLMFNFMCRLDLSENSIIMALTCPMMGYRFTSRLRKYWHDSLHLFLNKQ
ncbi:hypothetical protein ABVT39_010640 [Epinephelus coioides]